MSNLAETIQPEEEVIEQQALTLYEQATLLSVTDQASYQSAGELAKTLKSMGTKILDFFAPMKKSTHEAWKSVCSRENEALAPIKEADALLRKNMTRFIDEQEHIRREEQRKLEEAAREAARKEQERLLAQAAKADEKGKADKAEDLLERAENVYVAPVFVPAAVDKTVTINNGSVTRKTDLVITVTDLKALCGEVFAGRVPTTVLEAKPGALKSWAKINQVKQCPGLVIQETSTISVR
jgi:vacuolar-type H+-ATPase subunit I/STV1